MPEKLTGTRLGPPELFVSDPDRVARFEREAKTLAALDRKSVV